jgi:carotenoid cleavage dioxygenase-like enzyme
MDGTGCSVGCRALDSIIPGPDAGLNKFEWFSTRLRSINSTTTQQQDHIRRDKDDGLLFSRCYEWRLNMQTGQVRERNLTGTHFSMDFPFINPDFTGLQNRFGYTQVVDSIASSTSGAYYVGVVII